MRLLIIVSLFFLLGCGAQMILYEDQASKSYHFDMKSVDVTKVEKLTEQFASLYQLKYKHQDVSAHSSDAISIFLHNKYFVISTTNLPITSTLHLHVFKSRFHKINEDSYNRIIDNLVKDLENIEGITMQ